MDFSSSKDGVILQIIKIKTHAQTKITKNHALAILPVLLPYLVGSFPEADNDPKKLDIS